MSGSYLYDHVLGHRDVLWLFRTTVYPNWDGINLSAHQHRLHNGVSIHILETLITLQRATIPQIIIPFIRDVINLISGISIEPVSCRIGQRKGKRTQALAVRYITKKVIHF